MTVRLHVGDFEVAYRERRNLSDAVRIGVNYVATFPGGPSRSHGWLCQTNSMAVVVDPP